MLVLVIIVAYQNLKVVFTLNVMEKESKLALAYLISMYRRKGAGDNFSPYDEAKKYFVCENTMHHTTKQRRYVLAFELVGNLKPGAISKIKPRKSPKKRCLPATNDPLATILILKRNFKLITQITYYQSRTLKQILITRNCRKRRPTT